jgi:RNA polymerase sigma-70 factor (ECF subfamily)
MPENIIKQRPVEVVVEDLPYAIAGNDPHAFEVIYNHWVTPIYRYLFSRAGNKEDAQDVTSQTFMAVLQALPRYRHNGHFEAWLFTIARNQLLDFQRKHKRERDFPEGDELPRVLSFPDGDPKQREEIGLLRDMICGLREEDQELLRLRYTAGLAFGEIARLMNRNENAIKKSIYRLQEKLQKMLEAENG